jgi:AhpD family alkylhydroperoxidase
MWSTTLTPAWSAAVMSERRTEDWKPELGGLRFDSTRFDPDLTPFHGVAMEMAAQFGYSAALVGDPAMLQLLRLRVAQLNPCSYCLILHTEVAAHRGVPSVVVAHLASWRESAMFSTAEKAALAYCEGLTSFDHRQFPALHEDVRLHFSEREVAEIAAVVINMNVWTRLKLAQGAVPIQPDSAVRHVGSALDTHPGDRP